MRAHRGDQFARAGREADALPGALQRIDRQSLQHRHAFAQRRLEVELAIHRAGGDGGDAVLQAGEVGKFVERLAGDDGAVHVGDQQRLAPALGRRGDGVDGGASNAACTAAMSGAAGSSMSAASPDTSVVAAPPPVASRTRAMMAAVSVVAARLATRVSTWGMAREGQMAGALSVLVKSSPVNSKVSSRRFSRASTTQSTMFNCAG